VYGLNKDLDLNILEPTTGFFQISLRINGYFAPNADYDASTYVWTNEI